MSYAQAKLQELTEAASKLKCREEDVLPRLDSLLADHKALQEQMDKASAAQAKDDAAKLAAAAKAFGDVQAAVGQVSAADMDELRSIADMICSKLQNGVVVLAAVHEDKVSLVAKASKEAIAKGIHAGKLIKETAQQVGGGGGGRPDMAQAGGKQPEKVAEALAKAEEVIQAQLK